MNTRIVTVRHGIKEGYDKIYEDAYCDIQMTRLAGKKIEVRPYPHEPYRWQSVTYPTWCWIDEWLDLKEFDNEEE